MAFVAVCRNYPLFFPAAAVRTPEAQTTPS